MNMGLLRTFSQNVDAPFVGRVIMVSKEEHVPYDRPILSKVSMEFFILQRDLTNFWFLWSFKQKDFIVK